MKREKQQESQTYSDEIASYVERITFNDLSNNAITSLKHHLLDSIGCALNALTWEPVRKVQAMVEEDFDPRPDAKCTMIGLGTKKINTPQLAAFWNGALVRYIDFMDAYMAKMQTCHPSDNLSSVFASAEYAGLNGQEFLTALGIAYHIQCRFMDAMPSERKAFDHTVQLGISIAASCSKALGLSFEQTSNAIRMAATSVQGLDASRSGYLSNWKGLASAQAALGIMNCVMLAKHGITGPSRAFEGPHGVFEAFGDRFVIDWSKEDCERVTKCNIKKYNVEMHDQSLIEGMLELKRRENFNPNEVDKIEIETFAEANNITGSGKLAGNKYDVNTKDQADHSIPYMCAVSIIEGDIYPDQYRDATIRRPDVQSLLHKVSVKENQKYSRLFPGQIACQIRILLRDKRKLSLEKRDYEGMFSRPMPIEKVNEKFRRVTSSVMDHSIQNEAIDTVLDFENQSVSDLSRILSKIDLSKKKMTAYAS
jgi:2-methylcitrate dehydratase